MDPRLKTMTSCQGTIPQGAEQGAGSQEKLGGVKTPLAQYLGTWSGLHIAHGWDYIYFYVCTFTHTFAFKHVYILCMYIKNQFIIVYIHM